MKHFLLFLFFISQSSFAQLNGYESYKPVLITYNAKWEITKPEAAVYKRVAYFPDSLRSIENLSRPLFNGKVKDYYANNVVLAEGAYAQGKKWGTWSFYYPNGQLDCRGRFDGRNHVEQWEFWWPDGKPLMVVDFEEKNNRLLSFWNEKGEQTIKDGNGIYTAVTLGEKGQKMIMQGLYKDGLQAGEWTYGPVGGEVQARQTFNEAGIMVEGTIYEQGKKKERYTFGNRFVVEPEPKHLTNMEAWHPDRAYYQQGYPVIADIIKSEVQKVEVDKKLKTTTKHYYKIVQKFEAGADTLEYGLPTIQPVFKRNMESYIQANLKFPERLGNQKLEGTVVVSFTVDAHGKAVKPSIMKGLDPILDENVLKMIHKMPAWDPATYKGKPVEARVVIPIRVKNHYFMPEQEDEFNAQRYQYRPQLPTH
ncbi:energy transducer TonB [Pontibacter ruber]|uniref:TonB family protein n=1 Tax=Pontibacter ruber TaxID=1343895 RepID=A0ABW5CYD8_9BACT|nr:energy transducer TonB [Pontibacter ruber]